MNRKPGTGATLVLMALAGYYLACAFDCVRQVVDCAPCRQKAAAAPEGSGDGPAVTPDQ